jgi:hypothetical protein
MIEAPSFRAVGRLLPPCPAFRSDFLVTKSLEPPQLMGGRQRHYLEVLLKRPTLMSRPSAPNPQVQSTCTEVENRLPLIQHLPCIAQLLVVFLLLGPKK